MDSKGTLVYEEIEYGIKKINSWYKNNNKELSIITVPYNSSLIFGDIILDVIDNNQKVIYVWGGNRELKELLNRLRLVKKNISYGHIESEESFLDITFVHYDDILKVKGKYKLAIFDDITTSSTLSKSEVMRKYEYLNSISERIILYSIERINDYGENFELMPIYKGNPFVEPRLITTRIDLNKDIPYILYDYLNWFRDNKKKIILMFPDKEKLELAREYYSNKLKMNEVKVITFLKKDEKKIKSNVLKFKDKAIFILTDYMEVTLEIPKVEGVVVLFADDSRYKYKKLIYLCGEVGKINKEIPEVLFIANDISKDIEKVKEMTRGFNKMLWEKNLLKF